MLLTYGRTYVNKNWEVIEKTGAGFTRVYYVYKGFVRYTDDDTSFELKQGYLYIFPTIKPYTMRQDPNDRLKCTFFHLDVSPAIADELIMIDVDKDVLLKHILMTINAAIYEDNKKLTENMINIFESYCKDKGLISDIKEPFSVILKYISSNLHNKITVSELSRIAGYDDQYFIRLFRIKTGSPPHKYIISQRMNTAKRLMAKGMTVSETSKETGYSDIKTFSRAFKSYFGISPSDHKKTSTENP